MATLGVSPRREASRNGTSRASPSTQMLTESRAGLAHAMQQSPPPSLSSRRGSRPSPRPPVNSPRQDIQLDAQEMVRRAERGIGVAIRRGQESGEIAKREDNRFTSLVRSGDNASYKPSPTDFVGAAN